MKLNNLFPFLKKAAPQPAPPAPQRPTVDRTVVAVSHHTRVAEARAEWEETAKTVLDSLANELQTVSAWRYKQIIVDPITREELATYSAVAGENEMSIVVTGRHLPDNVAATVERANAKLRRITAGIAATPTYSWHMRHDLAPGILQAGSSTSLNYQVMEEYAAEVRLRSEKPVVFRGAQHLGALAFPSNKEKVTYFATDAVHASCYAGFSAWVAMYLVQEPERLANMQLALNIALAERIEEHEREHGYGTGDWLQNSLTYFQPDLKSYDALGSEAQEQSRMLDQWAEINYSRPRAEITLSQLDRMLAYPSDGLLAHWQDAGIIGAWLPSGELVVANSGCRHLRPLPRPTHLLG